MNGVIAGDTHDPHACSARTRRGDTTSIRTLRRGAERGDALVGDERHADAPGARRGRLRGRGARHGAPTTGSRWTATPIDDPYRHLPTLGELDLHLIGEGRHERLWTVLGAQAARRRRRVRGVGAQRARRAGGRRLHRLGRRTTAGRCARWAPAASGSCSCPDARAGAGTSTGSSAADGVWREKADPLAQRTEVPPATASVVYDSTTSGTTPSGWRRARRSAAAPGADERLRGAPRLVAARAWPTASWPTS